ncbi:Uncharacterised protein [uncultured archaeon]|nr:Uncharacterised protein [uncultured archaeon]
MKQPTRTNTSEQTGSGTKVPDTSASEIQPLEIAPHLREIEAGFLKERRVIKDALINLVPQVRRIGVDAVLPIPTSGDHAAYALTAVWKALHPEDRIPKIIPSEKNPYKGGFTVGPIQPGIKALVIDDVVRDGGAFQSFTEELRRTNPTVSATTATLFSYHQALYRAELTGKDGDSIGFWHKKTQPEEKALIRKLIDGLAQEIKAEADVKGKTDGSLV